MHNAIAACSTKSDALTAPCSLESGKGNLNGILSRVLIEGPGSSSMAEAIAAWGSRLELKGGQLTRRRRKVARHSRQKLQLGDQDGEVLMRLAEGWHHGSDAHTNQSTYGRMSLIEGLHCHQVNAA